MYTYPAEKDFSDSEAALNVAMNLMKERGERGRLDFLCATGGRLDHFLSNIGLLNTALRAGIDARILDAKNEIRLIDRSISLRREEIGGRYVSIIPYTERVENVTLRGFHYPLEGAAKEQWSPGRGRLRSATCARRRRRRSGSGGEF